MESIPTLQTKYSNRSLIKILKREIAQKVPHSVFEEVVEFIAENKHCEENLLRAGFESRKCGRCRLSMALLDRTLDSDTTRSIIEKVSMSVARWICKWMGDSWTSFLKISKEKQE